MLFGHRAPRKSKARAASTKPKGDLTPDVKFTGFASKVKRPGTAGRYSASSAPLGCPKRFLGSADRAWGRHGNAASSPGRPAPRRGVVPRKAPLDTKRPQPVTTAITPLAFKAGGSGSSPGAGSGLANGAALGTAAKGVPGTRTSSRSPTKRTPKSRSPAARHAARSGLAGPQGKHTGVGGSGPAGQTLPSSEAPRHSGVRNARGDTGALPGAAVGPVFRTRHKTRSRRRASKQGLSSLLARPTTAPRGSRPGGPVFIGGNHAVDNARNPALASASLLRSTSSMPPSPGRRASVEAVPSRTVTDPTGLISGWDEEMADSTPAAEEELLGTLVARNEGAASTTVRVCLMQVESLAMSPGWW